MSQKSSSFIIEYPLGIEDQRLTEPKREFPYLYRWGMNGSFLFSVS